MFLQLLKSRKHTHTLVLDAAADDPEPVLWHYHVQFVITPIMLPSTNMVHYVN